MFRPCYNLAWFHGIVSVVLNDEMADLIAKAIDDHPTKTNTLTALSADLKGQETEIEVEESLTEPSYDYSYFFGKTTLTINRPAAKEIANAILDTKERLNGALYALARELDNFANYEREAA